MKKKFFTGMFSILLVLGLVLTGCDISFLDDLIGGLDSGSGSNSGSDSNPFVGTSWRVTDGGYTMTLSFTSSSWTLRDSDGVSESGSYTYSGNTATCKQDGQTVFTARISGNNLTAVDYDGESLTFTKGGSSSGNGSNSNDNSNSGDNSGSGGGEIPTKPKNIKVIPDTDSTMKLEWSYGSIMDDVTGYNIYRSIESSSSGFTKVATVTSRTFTDTGLSSNTRYYYYVTAYNDSGESRASDSYKNTTAVLAGTTRDTATELKPGWGSIYYFPPGEDELWFYFNITNQENYVSIWDQSYDGNYYTAGNLRAGVESIYEDGTTSSGETYFGDGSASAYDRIRDDCSKSIYLSGTKLGLQNSRIWRKVIYLKVFSNGMKGTFSLCLSTM
jgi:hypothetical protein